MKFFKLRFNFFNGASWDYETLEIIAKNHTVLKESFLNETKYIQNRERTSLLLDIPTLQEKLWEEIKNDIETIDLTKPIVKLIELKDSYANEKIA